MLLTNLNAERKKTIAEMMNEEKADRDAKAAEIAKETVDGG